MQSDHHHIWIWIFAFLSITRNFHQHRWTAALFQEARAYILSTEAEAHSVASKLEYLLAGGNMDEFFSVEKASITCTEIPLILHVMMALF